MTSATVRRDPAPPNAVLSLARGQTAAERITTALVYATVLAVLVVHIVVSWGYIGVYFGDTGRWLYEVDRYAHGAVPYRDVFWGFPPLSMWVVGGLARLIGSDLTQIWTITASIAVVIGVVYASLVRQLIPGVLAIVVAGTGAALGVVYASNFSAPLVSGMYSPAVPVAVLLAFAQLTLFLRDWSRPSIATAALVGALGGGALLAKQDVWPAAITLAVASAWFTPDADRRRVVRVAAVAGGLLAVAGTGYGVLAAQHGLGALESIVTGYGLLQETRGINAPYLAQLLPEGIQLGIATMAVGAIAWLSGAWRTRGVGILILSGAALTLVALGIWLLQAELLARQVLAHGPARLPTLMERTLAPFAADGLERVRHALSALRPELLRRLIPFGMPLGVLLLAFVRRRQVEPLAWRLVVILLLFVLAIRSRRLLTYDEWSALMLEVPVYSYAAMTLFRLTPEALLRGVVLGCVILLEGALSAYRIVGWGIFSRRGVYPSVETARGHVRLSPNTAAMFRDSRELAFTADPTGTRPLLSFGYSAGHNYLLGREGVGSLTHGFRASLYPTPDSAFRVAMAQRDRLLLIDNRAYLDAIPAPAFEPWRWQPRMVPNHYVRVDRPLFERLKSGCRQITGNGERPRVVFYDCAPLRDTARAGR